LLARWGLSHLLSDATPGRSKKETNP
jgi:hypothetical protein